MELLAFINQVPYLGEALQLLLAGHALAIAIVNLTVTPKDNDAVSKAYKYIEILAGIVHPRAKT